MKNYKYEWFCDNCGKKMDEKTFVVFRSKTRKKLFFDFCSVACYNDFVKRSKKEDDENDKD